MTDIHTILLSELNRNLAGSDLAKDIDDALIERIRIAKSAYQSIPRNQLRIDVEEKRTQLLNEISMLQSETFFKVGHNDLLARMIPNILIPYLIDQGAAAYEARSEQDLNVLELNLTHFRGLLDQAVAGKAQRRMSRAYGIMGTIAGIALTGGALAYAAGTGLDKNWTIPILSIPVTVVVWSLIGSFAAMLYRFTMTGENALEHPLRWLFTRPMTGVVMGMVVYLMIKALLIVTGSTISFLTLGSQEVIWVMALFAGFSDRFCNAMLKLIVGGVGGIMMEGAQPPAAQPSGSAGVSHHTLSMLEELASTRRQKMRRAQPAEGYEPVDESMIVPPSRKGADNGKDAEL